MSKQTKTKGVVITTAHRAIFYGENPVVNGNVVEVQRARNCFYWGAETRGFLGLSLTGPLGNSKVGPAAPKLTIFDVTSIAECTDEAIEQWGKVAWK